MKAKSLGEFVAYQGAKQSTFMLTLSEEEAMELIDWYSEQYCDNEMLTQDVDIAKRTKNPWMVLENFRLLGFEMVKMSILH